jgi:uncharacterized OsmC-like protein
MNTNVLNGVDTQVLGSMFSSIQNNPEKAKATFSVQSEWNGEFTVVASCKDFQIGKQRMERKKGYTMVQDFPDQFSGEGKGPTVCESCMAGLGACITQTIVAHSTGMGIKLDKIRVDVEGDVDLRGFSGISRDVRAGAQQIRVKVHIDSHSATKEQIEQLYEIGKRLSPAVDTLTNGTSIVMTNS